MWGAWCSLCGLGRRRSHWKQPLALMMCSDPAEARKSAAGVSFFLSLNSSAQPRRSSSELFGSPAVTFECNCEVREAELQPHEDGFGCHFRAENSEISDKVVPVEASLRNCKEVVFFPLNCINNASCIWGTAGTCHITETSAGDTET